MTTKTKNLITAALVLFVFAIIVVAQQPAISRLNADASVTWNRINQAEKAENDRHQKELDRLNELRVVMLQAAGIPPDAWAGCAPDTAGAVVCQKPVTAKADKPKESPPK